MTPPPAPELPSQGALAGLDPGRSKCGLVRTDRARRRLLEALVIPPEQAWDRLEAWLSQGEVTAVILGNGTGSALWRRRLEPLAPVLLVEEYGSTLAARERFWDLHQPRGWRRLLPQGLRQPPRDWDDVVAQLLLERQLGHPLAKAPETR
ncbi:resolvase [Synechococcus sp. RedBA-s]|uniref:resolvase n=1 Tax=Synechococcus sp. RedBA-s TaxID=2823741 RepID=UPI0020CF6350|nr:resolvase [Synechococcus sp. RedBA-s]MCP9800437.1 resolvase [Synechococcus sp. RedBA-s]